VATKPDGFKDFVLDQLSGLPGLTYRTMFGGYGLYQHDIFFGIIHKGRRYFKTDRMAAPHYRNRGRNHSSPRLLRCSKIIMRFRSRSWKLLMTSPLGLLMPHNDKRPVLFQYVFHDRAEPAPSI
jgi:hypothetical protein